MSALRLNDNGYKWRRCAICRILEAGHDYDPDQVRQLFSRAAHFALEQNLPFDSNYDYAQAYMDSCDRTGIEPAIPDHVRQYCASLGKITLVTETTLENVITGLKKVVSAKEPSHPAKPKKTYKGDPLFRTPMPAYR